MSRPVVLLSVPGLRERDVAVMSHLRELTAGGEIAELVPTFPCVTCPVQANMTTGVLPDAHGVVANGFYWRDKHQVEMWTSPNECIEKPQLWDLLAHRQPPPRSAVWFPLHSKGCEADFVCTPAPIHNPDGSESLWCYTRPVELYGTLQKRLGHFPLQHFWGPLADVRSTSWIVESAIYAASMWKPEFFYIYLPHLDYAAQRAGPDSPQAQQAVVELDRLIGRLGREFAAAYDAAPLWLIAGEYTITPVNHVTYPNRVLREAGLLAIRQTDQGEELDLAASQAFALVDHQFSHVFVQNGQPATIARVVDLFKNRQGFAEVLWGEDLVQWHLAHPRSGEVVLVSTPDSWQAYYWWFSDEAAPSFARRVDIHRKPGYDPVELLFDPVTKGISLDATLIKGSHGAPARDPSQRTVLVASQPGLFPAETLADTDVFQIVWNQFSTP